MLVAACITSVYRARIHVDTDFFDGGTKPVTENGPRALAAQFMLQSAHYAVAAAVRILRGLHRKTLV